METMQECLDGVGGLFKAWELEQAPRKESEAKITALINKIAGLETRLEILQAKARTQYEQERLPSPYQGGKYLEPIAQAVLSRFPEMTYKILGPFGIGSRCAVHIVEGAGECERVVWSMSFTRCTQSGVVSYVDMSKDTKEFPAGSVGELNGLNFAEVPIKPEMPVDELIELGGGIRQRKIQG